MSAPQALATTAQLQARLAELEQSQAELQAFTASAAHELRTPLSALQSFCSLMESTLAELPQPQAREAERYAQRVRSGLDEMGRLVDALMRLSRASTAALHAEEVDLSALASELLDVLVARDPQRPRHLSVQPGLRAWGDRLLLRQLLENLLGNAWKFSARQPRVLIEFGRDADSGAFFVRDQGAGFDATQAPRLFQPFERLHGQAEFPGTGMGLATVRRIALRHGGQAWAQSRPEGATFFFSLGARPAPGHSLSV